MQYFLSGLDFVFPLQGNSSHPLCIRGLLTKPVRMAASGNLLDHKFDAVNDGKSKIFVGSEKYPVLKNFMELIAAFFKAGCVGVDAFANGYFAIVRSIVLQDFIGCMAHGGVYVVQQHEILSGAQGLGVGAFRPYFCLISSKSFNKTSEWS